jgi:hypothetical protein
MDAAGEAKEGGPVPILPSATIGHSPVLLMLARPGTPEFQSGIVLHPALTRDTGDVVLHHLFAPHIPDPKLLPELGGVESKGFRVRFRLWAELLLALRYESRVFCVGGLRSTFRARAEGRMCLVNVLISSISHALRSLVPAPEWPVSDAIEMLATDDRDMSVSTEAGMVASFHAACATDLCARGTDEKFHDPVPIPDLLFTLPVCLRAGRFEEHTRAGREACLSMLKAGHLAPWSRQDRLSPAEVYALRQMKSEPPAGPPDKKRRVGEGTDQ